MKLRPLLKSLLSLQHSKVEECSANCTHLVEYLSPCTLAYMKCPYDMEARLAIDGAHVWYVCLRNEKNWLRDANVAYDVYVVQQK